MAAPSMLDLVRLSRRTIFPPGGEDLYRHIALLTEISEGDELLDVACGVGTPLFYWVREYGIHGSGVDSDPEAVERAEGKAKEKELADSLQFQEGSAGDLPYRDEIFDVAVGEMGLTASVDPERAVRELVRVTKRGGSVVLVQLVWKAPVDPVRRKVLSAHLGARPLMLVELKRILREAGVVDLHTENWSDEETAFRRKITKPFPDFAELFSLPEKLAILRRAWRRWGWTGVKTALLRERDVHRLLTRERIIGLDLIVGTKVDHRADAVGSDPAQRGRGEEEKAPLPGMDAASGDEDGTNPSGDGVEEDPQPPEPEHEETAGLPLFGSDPSDEDRP